MRLSIGVGMAGKKSFTAKKGYFWQWKFDYIYSQINPELIRKLAHLNDESIKITLSGLICEIVGNLKLPQKAYKRELAKRLIMKNKSKSEVLRLTGISERTYYRLLKEYNE